MELGGPSVASLLRDDNGLRVGGVKRWSGKAAPPFYSFPPINTVIPSEAHAVCVARDLLVISKKSSIFAVCLRLQNTRY